MAVSIDRRQLLAYRITVQQLDRTAKNLADLAVLDLGLPDVNGTAHLAVSARMVGDTPDLSGLERIWSFRGAPYFHRPADLKKLAGELWPVNEDDAQPRLGWQRKQVASSGVTALDALTEVAEAMRASAQAHPLTKGAMSTAVTSRIRPELSWWCAGCKATHVSEQLMRLGGLPAGVRLDVGSSPLSLSLIPRWPAIPTKSRGLARIVDAYFRLYGPSTPADFAGYLSSTRTALKAEWPADLVEIDVSGRKTWLPEKYVDDVRAATPTPIVRLLGAGDPYLQSRDRDLLVPDKLAQKEIWRILGNPGAVLVDGEIAGTWRVKQAGKSRIELTVSEFGVIDPDARDEISAEAERIATVRGVADVRVKYVGA